MRKKILITLLAVFVSSIIVIGLLEFALYLQDNEDVKSASVKGVFHFMPGGHPDAPAINHLYSFTISPNGDNSKSTEWGTVGYSTEVKLVGKKNVAEFDKCFVRMEGRYFEIPTKESSLKHHLYKKLEITLIFN